VNRFVERNCDCSLTMQPAASYIGSRPGARARCDFTCSYKWPCGFAFDAYQQCIEYGRSNRLRQKCTLEMRILKCDEGSALGNRHRELALFRAPLTLHSTSTISLPCLLPRDRSVLPGCADPTAVLGQRTPIVGDLIGKPRNSIAVVCWPEGSATPGSQHAPHPRLNGRPLRRSVCARDS